MRVLVFGDSITQGYWSADGGWVNYLRKYFDEKQLEDLQVNDEPALFNMGVSADTSEDVLGRIRTETLARTRHDVKPIVIVQTGVNDSSIDHGHERVKPEDYEENLSRIIEVVSEVGNKLIFVGSSSCNEPQTMPVFWGDFIYSNERIKKYEDIMCKVAEKNRIVFVPVFEIFRQTFESEGDLLPDGLHPNDKGHKLIYDIVKPEIEGLIR